MVSQTSRTRDSPSKLTGNNEIYQQILSNSNFLLPQLIKPEVISKIDTEDFPYLANTKRFSTDLKLKVRPQIDL